MIWSARGLACLVTVAGLSGAPVAALLCAAFCLPADGVYGGVAGHVAHDARSTPEPTTHAHHHVHAAAESAAGRGIVATPAGVRLGAASAADCPEGLAARMTACRVERDDVTGLNSPPQLSRATPAASAGGVSAAPGILRVPLHVSPPSPAGPSPVLRI